MIPPHRLRHRARRVERGRGAVGRELQAAAVELALAAPFLPLQELGRWRRRVAAWRQGALADAALLGRLDTLLGRYTASGRPATRTRASA
jgi:hypothetical protein